jgi:hypothetical protein
MINSGLGLVELVYPVDNDENGMMVDFLLPVVVDKHQ